MPIDRLRMTNVGPFDDIEFEFDRQVNVLTGPNNSGKSTALCVLGDALVFPFGFPDKLLWGNTISEFTIGLSNDSNRAFSGQLPIRKNGGYWDEPRWSDYISILKEVRYSNFIPAMRQSTDYRSSGPTVSSNQSLERPSDAARQRIYWPAESTRREIERLYEQRALFMEGLGDRQHLGDEEAKRLRLVSSSASSVSDEAVIQKIIDLDYRSYRLDEPEVRNIISLIGRMASQITEGFPIQFQRVEEDERGLFPQFRTPDGDIPLNVLSQGTQSIIQWLAHLLIGYAEYYEFPSDLAEYPGIVIIDEIDAHLHPSWQRGIIPTLSEYFPNLQIFCSTHSPLMLAGLRAGQVQLLRRNEKGQVSVSRNDHDIRGWSADEILRGILDVPEPTDFETVSHLNRLRQLRGKKKLTIEESAELEQLRHRVSKDLMASPRSAQVEEFANLLRESRDDPTASGE